MLLPTRPVAGFGLDSSSSREDEVVDMVVMRSKSFWRRSFCALRSALASRRAFRRRARMVRSLKISILAVPTHAASQQKLATIQSIPPEPIRQVKSSPPLPTIRRNLRIFPTAGPQARRIWWVFFRRPPRVSRIWNRGRAFRPRWSSVSPGALTRGN